MRFPLWHQTENKNERRMLISFDVQRTKQVTTINRYGYPYSLINAEQSSKMVVMVYIKPDSVMTRIAKMKEECMRRQGMRFLTIFIVMAA